MLTSLLSEAVKSPCSECDWHLEGNSKNCEKCEGCERRIAYYNFIDDGTSGGIMEVEFEIPLSIKKQEPVSFYGIDWAAIEAEYIESVVERKKSVAWLAQYFDISVKTLYEHRSKHGWPKIKVLKCKTNGCNNPAEVKGDCKKCYQRAWMRNKRDSKGTEEK